jgi:hypothetical protein
MPDGWKGGYSRRLAKAASERGRRMANARWKIWRDAAHLRPEPEPKMVRWHRFEFGVRDKLNGETHFVDLKSVRHATHALGLILKHLN